MKRDGGPAFPRPHSWDESPVSGVHEGDRIEPHSAQAGMSLRDYFAAQAVPGLVAGAECFDTHAIAHDAYALADAMLAERAK